jgi:hypothetical protein
MANKYMQAAKMAYGFSGTTQKILWFLCDEIHSKFNEKKVGFVFRSYDLIAFRCACSRKTVTAAVNQLREMKVLKTIKKGPHRCYMFCIYLEKLQAFRREWEVEKREREIHEAFSDREPTEEELAEDELMFVADAADEEDILAEDAAIEEAIEINRHLPVTRQAKTAAVRPVTSEVGLPIATPSNQSLPSVTSPAREVMSEAREVMARNTGSNVRTRQNGAEDFDCDGLPEPARNSNGGSLSGVAFGLSSETTQLKVPLGPSVLEHVQSTLASLEKPKTQSSGDFVPRTPNRDIVPGPKGVLPVAEEPTRDLPLPLPSEASASTGSTLITASPVLQNRCAANTARIAESAPSVSNCTHTFRFGKAKRGARSSVASERTLRHDPQSSV